MGKTKQFAEGVEFTSPIPDEFTEIMTPEAAEFVAKLARQFGGRVEEILKKRAERQERIFAGELPDFLPETRHVRESEWKIAPIPDDLQDRRVELTGPPDRKMTINALNSGAATWMADFEDANCPTWHNMLESQLNLRDAINRSITYDDPNTGKHYELNEDLTSLATIIARPRGWHLYEKHMIVDGKQVPAGIFDFGLYFFHNVRTLLEGGTGPYFYLPKMESHLEARLWNDVFVAAQEELGIPSGTIKATVLIETILATFEEHEILYELREHAAGLNCGRWDYIFSYIKRFRDKDMLLPDRAQVTMTVPFMRAYTLYTIKTCHKRGAHAIGGMAAQIPLPDDPEWTEFAYNKVREDKEREANDGHDGTWVAHPGMVGTAKEAFDEVMPQANQIDREAPDITPNAIELLKKPEGNITEEGFRNNISVGIQYLAAWLAGRGAVPIFGLMEDTATAEISRAQVWQLIHHSKGVFDDGTEVTEELFYKIRDEELEKIKDIVGEERYENDEFGKAVELFTRISTDNDFVEFLTYPGYEYLD